MSRLLRLLIVVLGWLVTVAFAGAYAAYYVPPAWLWWLQVLGLALPVLAIVLVPLTVGSFLVRRPRLGLVQVAALVLFLLRHAPFGLLDHDVVPGDSESIRVISYNTHGGKAYMVGEDSDVVEIVRGVNPDVVCLQEFGAEPSRARPGTAALILTSLGYNQVARVPPGRRETRRPILTRFRIRESAFLSLAEGEESYAVRALLDDGTNVFGIYNVHLRGLSPDRPWRGDGNVLDPRDWLEFFRSSGGSYVTRAREAEKLREYLAAETHPFLVCGDLNSTSNQWTYHHLADELQDAFQVAGEGWGKTYHARVPVVRIDYILASEEWQVHSADAVSSRTSDHRAVVAQLGLPDARDRESTAPSTSP